MIVNKRELSELLNVTERTLTDWQDDGLPIANRGVRGQEHQYDTVAVVRWLTERAEAKARAAETAYDRLARTRADRLEMQVASERGGLVPTADVEPMWRMRVLATAIFMRGRDARLAALLQLAPGIEAKREILKREDAAFLAFIGTRGRCLQTEVETLLAQLAAADAEAFLRRVAGP